MTKKEQIIASAIEVISNYPEGIRYSKLSKEIHKKCPEINLRTIQGQVVKLDTSIPDKIYKPAKGLFRLVEFREKELAIEKNPSNDLKILCENDFYEPFAEWLVKEMEECTKAIPLGGKRFQDKWGTPDVIGIREPKRSDIIPFPTEIVSAEIKIDTKELITAFGQACAYILFSHKCYIVVPKASSPEDISKLDSLCMIFGIGLILFDHLNADDPQFEIRVRPFKHEPDMFYVNQYLKNIEKELF
jgi:hypothetical protein